MKSDFKGFQYIIFDADGTIFDSLELYVRLFAEMFGSNSEFSEYSFAERLTASGGDLNSMFFFRLVLESNTSENGTAESHLKLLKDKDIERARMQADFVQKIKSEKPPGIFKGVKKTLFDLHASGFKMFLTSSMPSDVLQKWLKAAEIANMFLQAGVIGAERILKGVGHIDVCARLVGKGFEDFCKRLVLVSNWPYDMKLARELKVCSIGMTHSELDELVHKHRLKKSGATAVIHSLKRLILAIKSIEAQRYKRKKSLSAGNSQ